MKAYGGYSIAVYQKKDAKVEDLLQRGRVDYIYPADYSENSGLDNTVKNIIQKMAISETLYREYSKQKHEINNWYFSKGILDGFPFYYAIFCL